MLVLRNPHEAYRRVDFYARVEGADSSQLVVLCYEQAGAALSAALFAHRANNNQAKSLAMTRALSAITALQLGVSGDADVSGALRQFYGAVRRGLLDCALNFDPSAIETIRSDLADIAAAFARCEPDS